MGNLRACFVVAISALAAACGDDGGGAKVADASVDSAPDAKIFMDAPPPMFDFTCATNTTPPATAAANITIGGTVQSVTPSGLAVDIVPVNGAAVQACLAGAANCNGGNTDGNDTTDATGAFSIGPFATAMAPQDDFIEMTATGQRTTYVYPASPFVADQGNVPVLTFTNTGPTSGEAALSALLGCNTTGSIVGLAVTDCAGAPVTDTANLTVKINGTAVPAGDLIDLGEFQAEAAGTFLVCGVAANAATTVGATYKTTNFITHSVKTVAGTTTATLLIPGY